jgi:hypothetical protein
MHVNEKIIYMELGQRIVIMTQRASSDEKGTKGAKTSQGVSRLSFQWSRLTWVSASVTLLMASAASAMDGAFNRDCPLDRNVNLSDRVWRLSSRAFAATSSAETVLFLGACPLSIKYA